MSSDFLGVDRVSRRWRSFHFGFFNPALTGWASHVAHLAALNCRFLAALGMTTPGGAELQIPRCALQIPRCARNDKMALQIAGASKRTRQLQSPVYAFASI